jgi:hypothetical protein
MIVLGQVLECLFLQCDLGCFILLPLTIGGFRSPRSPSFLFLKFNWCFYPLFLSHALPLAGPACQTLSPASPIAARALIVGHGRRLHTGDHPLAIVPRGYVKNRPCPSPLPRFKPNHRPLAETLAIFPITAATTSTVVAILFFPATCRRQIRCTRWVVLRFLTATASLILLDPFQASPLHFRCCTGFPAKLSRAAAATRRAVPLQSLSARSDPLVSLRARWPRSCAPCSMLFPPNLPPRCTPPPAEPCAGRALATVKVVGRPWPAWARPAIEPTCQRLGLTRSCADLAFCCHFVLPAYLKACKICRNFSRSPKNMNLVLLSSYG